MALRLLAAAFASTLGLVGCTTPAEEGMPTSIAVATSLTTTSETHTARQVTVRYRSDPVDIAHPAFEHLDTTDSSLVRGAWFDSATGYMIISLNGTYYHYCSMPQSAWRAFKAATSFGSHYNAAIKGRYGCQGAAVPDY